MSALQTWRLTLAWNGARYSGWQRQPDGGSIQQVVEDALSRVLGGAPVKVRASGRTDAGVHALAQVASFRTDQPRTAFKLLSGLNANLPVDIAALDVAPAPDDFDIRRWVLRKRYRYRVLNRRPRCPFRREMTWHWRGGLDEAAVAAMHQAAAALVGRHDFSSFRAAGCGAAHPVRTLEAATVIAQDDEVHFDFVGNGFLRHQVRIMVGTLMEVGTGRRSALVEALEARDRRAAGATAPAAGLWLINVELGDGPRQAVGAEALEERGDEDED